MKRTGPDPNEANAPRWARGPFSFYEVWYVIAVDPGSGDGFWIRYTLLNPRVRHPQAGGTVWFAYTCRQEPGRSLALQQHFLTNELELASSELHLLFGQKGTNRWIGDTLEGAIEGPLVPKQVAIPWSPAPSGPMEGRLRTAAWQLRLEGDPSHPCAPHALLPDWLRRWTESRTGVTIPRPRLRLTGRIEIDGKPLELTGAVGHQAHHWGTRRASGWDWAHCAHFEEDPDAVLEILAPQLAKGHLQPLFLRLRSLGMDFSFHRPWDLARGRCHAGLGEFRFYAESYSARVTVEIKCDPNLFTAFTYLSPSYGPSRCWNTQVGNCRVVIERPGGDNFVLTSRGKTSAEMHRSSLAELPYEQMHLD